VYKKVKSFLLRSKKKERKDGKEVSWLRSIDETGLL